jgi:hypothetical protein
MDASNVWGLGYSASENLRRTEEGIVWRQKKSVTPFYGISNYPISLVVSPRAHEKIASMRGARPYTNVDVFAYTKGGTVHPVCMLTPHSYAPGVTHRMPPFKYNEDDRSMELADDGQRHFPLARQALAADDVVECFGAKFTIGFYGDSESVEFGGRLWPAEDRREELLLALDLDGAGEWRFTAHQL